MRLKKLMFSTLIASMLLVVGCGQEADQETDQGAIQQPSTPSRAAPARPHSWDPSLADRARLIDVLPDSTLAYVRLPTLWGLLAAPKSGALQSALGSAANRDTIMALQAGIPEVVEAEFGEFAPLLSLLLAELRSPLEVALVGEGPQPLEADLVIEARLALGSFDELNALFERYTDPSSPFQLLQAASADQPGQLLVGVFPMFYHFDSDSHRVRMVGGMSAGRESFEQAQSLTAAAPTALKQREQTVDDSGLGFMLWADGTRLMPALEQMASPDDLAELRDLGVMGLEEIALAYGSQAGKARLSLVARGEDGPLWDYGLPAIGPSTLPIAGQADYVAGWVVPDFAWIDTVWRALSPDAESQIEALDGLASEATGLSLADWANAFAGRWTLIGDDSGTSLVQEPVQPEAWSRLINGLSERFDVRQSEVESRGRTFRHLIIPGVSIPEMLPETDDLPDQIARVLAERMMSIGTHVHWMEDAQGRRTLATVPQTLRDRIALSGEQGVADWLGQTGVAHDSAAVFGAIEIANAPRRNYYAYLTLLQAMGDVLDINVNLHGFPSAHELELADHGSVGMEMHYSDGSLGLALVFENHPGDVIYSGTGGIAGMAMVGALAAIAIPAYQDYAERATSSEFLMFAASAKLAVAEFYRSEGRLPNAEEAPGFAQVFDEGPVSRIDYNARLLRLVLQLSPEAGFGDNATLELVPILQDGTISRWRCSSATIDLDSLPSECRP